MPTQDENLYLQHFGTISYQLKEPFDFSFLEKYGKVFCVFDTQDSGNICFGVEKNGEKLFVKFAGASTIRYNGTPEDAVARLKATLPVYRDLRHRCLVELVTAEEVGGGFAMVFRWATGDCMGRMYDAQHRRFMALPPKEKLTVFRDILDFLDHIVKNGYVAIDLYDGSVMYDVQTHRTTICDIDFFRKQPCINDMGRMWGSSRFQSPEEYRRGDVIDEVTNVYTAGAMAFALFGGYERTIEAWQLSKEAFAVAKKATADDRNQRYQSIQELASAWEQALN